MTKLAFIRTKLRKYRDNRRGAVSGIVALAMIPLVTLMGFSVDLGRVLMIQQNLQQSSDAAALAGAGVIATNGNPVGTAMIYSGLSGDMNAKSAISTTMASGYPILKCFQSTGAPCVGTTPANGIIVREQATVQLYFTKIFGLSTLSVSATATAGSAGAKAMPLNVMLILDTTASMNDTDPGCSVQGASRIGCALAGAQQLLAALTPSVDQIGLMVFPGLQANQAQYDYDCSNSPQPRIAAYNANPNYTITAPASNFRTSDSTTSLNTGSDLVKAVGGGGSGCSGLNAIGGVSTFYADAIWQAQTSLQNTQQSGEQNVIIFLSDGDANATTTVSSSCPSGSTTWCVGAENTNECHAAIRASQAAAAAGTWVFSIAYGSPTGASCSTDTKPTITACSTMQQIASDSSKFYSDGNGVAGGCTSSNNSLSELVSIFKTIGVSLQEPRLLPNNTT